MMPWLIVAPAIVVISLCFGIVAAFIWNIIE